MRRMWSCLALLALLVCLAAPGMAEEAAPAAEAVAEAAAAPEFLSQTNANILWTLVASILVMFMQAGFACVECGFTRAKSAANIMLKNMLDFAAGQPLFFLVGFGLMFGKDVGGFIGMGDFGLLGAGLDTPDGRWTYTFWFFQSVFAATSATIVSGAIAERMKFTSYVFMSMAMTALIYPISGHWAWGTLYYTTAEAGGGGWLAAMGFTDFAGSTVVHSVGGWVALAGAMIVGPRIGKYGPDGKARAIPGHNIPLAALGVFILWFGWFGFNPGSTTVANDLIGLIAVNTSLAGAIGAFCAMMFTWVRYGKPDVSMSLNGALAGLVAITAPCATVSPYAALIIGAVAGVLVVLSVEFVDQVLKIDDPVGAVSVHGVCGAFGTLSAGLFNNPALTLDKSGGLFYGGGFGPLITQAIGVGAVFVWAFGTGYILFQVIKAVMGVRVHAEEELKGMDISEHGCEAYNGFQVFTVD